MCVYDYFLSAIGVIRILIFFCFKQKTAYEMRISDWSSDVCSSDLPPEPAPPPKSAESEQKGGSAQDDSGQSGPAHAAPEPNSARTTESGAQNAQQKSGLSAPVPAKPGGTSKESVITVAEAERLTRAKDIPACRGAGRELRLSGVAMPSPLLQLIRPAPQYQQ